ncbi:hypothetical protein [Dialister succinatiphilus]|uniref:hypothetical protein n=1 Tax=Dialister succinatiphilus TaxID=487173 RepID=UPI003AEF3ACE
MTKQERKFLLNQYKKYYEIVEYYGIFIMANETGLPDGERPIYKAAYHGYVALRRIVESLVPIGERYDVMMAAEEHGRNKAYKLLTPEQKERLKTVYNIIL